MKAHIIINPAAGQPANRAAIAAALAYLAEAGWSLVERHSEARGDVTHLARLAAEQGAEAVVVVGGDGTLSEAANGLVGTGVALGLLPMGTGNVWAAQLGLMPSPTLLYRPDVMAAARLLVESRPALIDVGQAHTPTGERYFMLWSGIGLDAMIQQTLDEEARPAKRRFGQWAYVWAAARPIFAFRGVRARLHLDRMRRRSRVMFVVVTNIPLYASILMAPEARADDGWLDVCVFEGHTWLDTLKHIGQLAFRRHLADPTVHFFRAREIEINTSRTLPVHLDGDPIARTPLIARVVPRALTVLLPPGAAQGLLTQPVTE